MVVLSFKHIKTNGLFLFCPTNLKMKILNEKYYKIKKKKENFWIAEIIFIEQSHRK